MATRQHDQIVETATEARQAEPGPSVLALLTISTGLAVLILGVVWALTNTERFADQHGIRLVVSVLASVVSWPVLLIPLVCAA